MEGESNQSTLTPRAWGEQEAPMFFPYENPRGLSSPQGQPPSSPQGTLFPT